MRRDVFYEVISASKSLREQFAKVAVKLQTEPELKDRDEKIKAVLEKIGKKDENGLTKDIRKRIKALTAEED